MSRGIVPILLAVAFAHPAAAHFVFLLPPGDGKTATAIFADSPTKDETVEIGKIEFKTARVVSVSGNTADVAVQPEAGGWRVPVAADTAEVRATVEYGVVNRGEGHVIRLRHHARLLLGDTPASVPTAAFDVAPVRVPSGVAFRVTFDGKPVAGAEVTVHEPDSDQRKVLKADADGQTPAFAKPGRYCARAMHVEQTPGEFEGRKYAVTHSHATATVVMN